MFLKIEDGRFQARIYRDARLIVVFPGLLGAWFMYSAVFTPEAMDGAALQFFMVGLGTPLFFWFLARWLLHGSITLDSRKNTLTFSESWNLQSPNLTVRKENIDQVKMKYYSGNRRPGGGGGGYKLILLFREGRSYEEKVLNLFFTKYDDSERAAKLIGKFADKPAFDHHGNKIFSPSS